MRRLHRFFLDLGDEDRGLATAVGLGGALFLVHYILYAPWYVEDAAISFAFARHLAEGHGFVAYPGGETVEGFSNPSWTILLALLHALGVQPFIAAKLLGAGLGLGALVGATLWARSIIDAPSRRFAALVPFLLAVQPGFVMWCAAGLENALLSALVVAGMLRSMREMRDEGLLPLSALAWLGVALTRPEGIAYAGLGGAITALGIAQRRGLLAALRASLGWLLIFGVPFAAWHAWRFETFGWPFPNTYYAKLGDGDGGVFEWRGKGWRYLQNWGLYTGKGLLLPLLAMGQVGLRGRRSGWALGLVAITTLAVVLGTNGVQHLIGTSGTREPEWLGLLRLGAIALCIVALPLLGAHRAQQPARAAAWCMVSFACFFAVYSGGDWMNGFRWPHMMAAPFAVLLADALACVASALRGFPRPRLARAALTLCTGFPLCAGLVRIGVELSSMETSPYSVRARVVYMQQVARKLALERPSAGEIDMGAHLWWSDFELVDLAGLLDVPVGHHSWEGPFMAEYIHGERRPDFMHIHSFWGKRTGVEHAAWFNDNWVEIPAYATGPVHQHPGNHVRKDLVLRPSWPEADLDLALGRVAILRGARLLSAEVAPGGTATLVLDVQKRSLFSELRMTLFVARDSQVVHTADAPLLHDWLAQKTIPVAEIARTRIEMTLPAALPAGEYTWGLVAWTGGARAVPLLPPEPVENPVFAVQEIELGTLTVVSDADIASRVEQVWSRATSAAEQGDCEAADNLARQAHTVSLARAEPLELDRAWLDSLRAACWATQARDEDDVEAIAWARRLDPSHPLVQQVGRSLATDWINRAEGQQAQAAYEWLRDALRADPSRVHVRRRAEALRDKRLGLQAHP